MFTSCEREEDISGGGSQTELILPTGPPVTVNFTVSIGNGEEEKEASPNPSKGGEMEKTTTRSAVTPPSSAVTPSSAALQMPPKDEDSPDFANALYFSPPAGEIEGDLEGTLYISSTIEENAPSITLRAMPLDPDIKVRVLAYSIAPAPNDTLYSYADYEVDAGHNLVPYGTAPLTVLSGGNVLFVAYSFNADTLPPHAATISNIGCYDLIYVADNVLVSSSNMTVHLTLEHLFSKINLVADAQLNSGNSIDTIYGARYNHTFPDLSVHTGVLTPAGSPGAPIPFISNAPGSTGNPWKSKEHYVYLPPPAPPSIVVTIDSVKIDTDTYKNSPTPPWTIDYGTALEPGKEYTLNVYFSSSCIDVTGISISSSSSTVVVGNTVTLTATGLTPTNATGVSYIWEVYTPAGWMAIDTTSANTCMAEVLNVGFNMFRVTATNSCTATPPDATTTVTGTPIIPDVGGSAARITWEEPSANYPAGRYILTYDPRDGGLYFKFGSVVGIYSDDKKNLELTPPIIPGTDTFDPGDIPWNLLNVSLSGSAGWTQIPYSSSSVNAAYHTANNVKAGLGDPCRLVGLDLDYIKKTPAGSLTLADIDNGTWRMPTDQENKDFSGQSNDTNYSYSLHWWGSSQAGSISYGVAGGEFPERNLGGTLKFLPAGGFRLDTDGSKNYTAGLYGWYWGSTIYQGGGALFSFADAYVHSLTSTNRAAGISVRCVNDPNPAPPPPSTWSTNPYIGTFHRHNETGERVIYSSHTGAWTAEVVDGNFIILDQGDANINSRLTDMYINNIPGNPESNQVSGSATSVNGFDNILFRVGMNSTIASNAVRYGKIKVTWNNSGTTETSYLYVRQGEEPDNVSDYSSLSDFANIKWSPYNAGNVRQQSPHQYGNGGFVDYPTKAGYFYQWGYSRIFSEPLSYPPQGNITIPNNNSSNTIYTLATVCPPNYKVPSGEFTVTGELGSLVEGTGIDDYGTRSVWGYYADGFFDRRKIEDSEIDGISNSVVSKGNDDVAYIGRLVYHPTTNASLFLPAAGMRFNYGNLTNAGMYGRYWSGTNNNYNNGDNVPHLWVLDSHLSILDLYKSYALSVRCVYEYCVPVNIINLSASPGGNPTIGTPVTITATPTPANAAPPSYSWEYSFNSGVDWYPVLGSTGNILVVPATLTPTQYRALAVNNCSNRTSTPVTITGSGVPPDDPGLLPAGDVLSYVGAFWKANETGERVIRIDLGSNANNYGPWSVVTVQYDGRWDYANGDGIMFAPGGSADPNIYTNNPNPAENYNLSSIPGGSYSAFVGGTASASNRYIEFRIFPQKSFTSTGKFWADQTIAANDADYVNTWPARYALIYLTYGNGGKRQNIYLRQGEGSDYVMYDQGFSVPSSSSEPGYTHPNNGTKRPQTVRMSPYNLTDPTFNSQTDYNNIVEPGVRSGIFTDYPSKGGYHFVHNNSRKPTNPFSLHIDNYPFTGAFPNNPVTWDPKVHETCPPGYKRPTDGPDSQGPGASNVEYSEIRQSLFLVLQSGGPQAPTNSTWGYYADGYFDRRPLEIITQMELYNIGMGSFVTTASFGTKDVADAGVMFYSAKTLAHIFLPSAGERYAASSSTASGNGNLQRFGYWGYYATKTRFNMGISPYGVGAMALRLGTVGSSSATAAPYMDGITYGAIGVSIRCIRDYGND